jgi:two-component system, NarL family, sensor kinase
LPAALDDLAGATRSRGIAVTIDADPQTADVLDAEQSRLLFQITQECLRNVVKHADAHQVHVTLARPSERADVVRLDIADDGTGFDVSDVLARPPDDHFGLRLLGDLSSGAGALLQVRSAPGRGTHWRVEVAA